MKVAILGASGETGQSIVNALSQSATSFTVTALVRPSSFEKPEVQDLKTQGVEVVRFDLEAPHEELVRLLAGQDVVISCAIPTSAQQQIKLVDASKEAGVKRFVPSAFATACPPKGVLILKDIKQEILNHIQKIYLPYTVIDVGWWYQNSFPRVPSGKIDYAVRFPVTHLARDGSLPSALTDLRDVGKYVERIISDPRTLNKMVFVHNQVVTQEQIFSTIEEASGEKVEREYLDDESIDKIIDGAAAQYKSDPSVMNLLGLTSTQYNKSVWLRGDNLPESAVYLGYLDGKELYPDLEFTTLNEYAQQLVAGQAKGVYMNRVFDFMKSDDSK